MGKMIRRGRDIVRDAVRDKPLIKAPLVGIETSVEQWKHSLAKRFPSMIKPKTRKMTVAITAQCNLRCVGCRYGRDFMPGHVLSLDMVKNLMDELQAGQVVPTDAQRHDLKHLVQEDILPGVVPPARGAIRLRLGPGTSLPSDKEIVAALARAGIHRFHTIPLQQRGSTQVGYFDLLFSHASAGSSGPFISAVYAIWPICAILPARSGRARCARLPASWPASQPVGQLGDWQAG